MSVSEQFDFDLELFKFNYDLQFKLKSESFFMKLLFNLTLMRFWNPGFMTDYTSTIGSTIYLAEPLEPTLSNLALLRHEVQHIEDSYIYGNILWALAYLFPQSLSLLALFAFWHPAWLLWLVALGPWPAPFRVWAELRGYARTYWTHKEFATLNEDVWYQRMHTTFCGWKYWRMSSDWKSTRAAMRDLLNSTGSR